MENARKLGKKLQDAQKILKIERRKEQAQNEEFRTLDKDINTIRPVIMKLQDRKKALHTYERESL